jgi:hypothetical protein
MDINYDMRPDLPDDEEYEVLPYRKRASKTDQKEVRKKSVISEK